MIITEKQQDKGFYISVVEGNAEINVYQEVSLVTGQKDEVKIGWDGCGGCIIEDAADFQKCFKEALNIARRRD